MRYWRNLAGDRLRGLVALFFGALVVVFGISQVGADEPKKGGTLTIGLETDFRGFDALKARVLGISASTAANLIMERLLEPAEDGGVIWRLATGREKSDDGKVLRTSLRQGVTFHDGTPFTADAVVDYFTRILDPKNKYVGLLFIYPIETVTKVDDFTVDFNLRHPWGVPDKGGAHSFTAYIPSPKASADDTHNRAPVGTGAFMFDEWQGGDKFVVKRNPDYWDKDNIHLDVIVFRFLPDQQTRYAALQSGEVDMIWTDRPSSILKAKKDPNLVTYSRDGLGALITFLNTSKPPLDDLRVRQAVSHAWNQALYVKAALKDVVPVAETALGLESGCSDTGYLAHDIEKAKALVAAYGKPVELEMIHTTTPRGRETGEIMQQFLRKAGIKLTLQPVDQLQLRQRVFTNNYQISGWRIADAPDVGPQLFALQFSKSPYNLPHLSDETMDKLVYAQRIEPDPKKRNQRLCQLSAYINQQATILFSGGRRHYSVARPYVKGLGPLFQGVIDPRYAWIDK